MLKSPIEKLRNRVLGKGSTNNGTELTGILDMSREFGCLMDIVGREFEVKDRDNNVIYTITQKPIAIKQLNLLLKEFEIIKKLDNEREAAKWGKKGKK